MSRLIVTEKWDAVNAFRGFTIERSGKSGLNEYLLAAADGKRTCLY